MRRLLLLSLLASGTIGLPVFVPAPAFAQIGTDRIIDVYGDEKCPSSNGQEIVVCHHHDLQEKYRIPKNLRDEEPTPQAGGGNANAMSAQASTGGTGVQINSCNAIGGGVNAGCTKKEIDAWKAQQRADKKAEEGIP